MTVRTKKAPDQLTVALSYTPATQAELEKVAKNLDVSSVADIPDGYIAGWASTEEVDLVRDVVVTGAFSDSISKRGLIGPMGIKLLLDHRMDRVAGCIKRLEYIDGKLWIEAQLELEISYVRDAYLAAKMAGGMSFSVGFRIQDYEFKDVDDVEVLYINKGDLFEVSVVAFPANPGAVMTFIKNASDFDRFDNLADLEKALAANRFQVTTRNQAKSLVQAIKRLVLPRSAPAAAPELDYTEAIALAKSINAN